MAESYENITTLAVRTTVELIELEPGLHAYKRTRTSEVLEKGGSFDLMPKELSFRKTEQGFVDAENRERLLAGEEWEPLKLRVLREEGRDLYRRIGFGSVNGDEPEYVAASEAHPFDAVASGRVVPDDVVEINHYDHSIRRRDGSRLPQAIHFDYIDAHIRDADYDLKMLAEHLLARGDVTIFKAKYGRIDHKSRATTVGEAITQIPGYNGGGSTIEFRWSPDAEAMAKLEAHIKEKGRRASFSSALVSAVYETDALGFRAAGAVRSDNLSRRIEATEDEEEVGGPRP